MPASPNPEPQAEQPAGERRILITGGAGFIGSHLVEAYLAADWKVGVVDNLSTGHRENLADWPVDFYDVDILDRPKLKSVFSDFRPTHVSHHAAQVSVRQSLESPVFDAEVNILGTLNVLQAAIEHSAAHFIFASSGGAIYGEITDRQPADEQHPKQPTSPYGLSKLAAEQYLVWMCQQANLPLTILRYSNAYGPRQDPAGEAGVISLFLDRFKVQQSAKIYGSGEQVRDFIAVKDIAAANLKVTEQSLTGTYNVASGQITSVNQLYDQLTTIWQQKTGRTLPEPEKLPAIPGEVFWSQISADLLQEKTGWQPRVHLAEGLRSTVN